MPGLRKGKEMEEKEVVIRIRHLSKEYRLGVIGRGTLQRDLRAGGQENVGNPIQISGSDAENILQKSVFMHWKMFPLMCTEENGSE